MKIGYSCMPNMKRTINAHNKYILNSRTATTPPKCNCTKQPCPTQPIPCTTENVLYEAEVTSGNEACYYIGSASTSFKTRWNNHKSSFKYQQYRNATELSKHIWSLKDDKKPYSIKWRITKKLKRSNSNRDPCKLCQSEAYTILRKKGKIINKRTEIMGKCRHQASGKLVNWLKKPARIKPTWPLGANAWMFGMCAAALNFALCTTHAREWCRICNCDCFFVYVGNVYVTYDLCFHPFPIPYLFSCT